VTRCTNHSVVTFYEIRLGIADSRGFAVVSFSERRLWLRQRSYDSLGAWHTALHKNQGRNGAKLGDYCLPLLT
jgi:hypothetical protein